MSRGVGFRIFTEINRPDRSLVELFRGLPTSNIGDEMNRMYCMSAGIAPLNDVPLLGTAITVKAPIGDNLVFHHALDIAKPGDVIVVDGAGDLGRSLGGEMMITYAEKHGIAGIVVDGALRDLNGIKRVRISVYAKGITPQGPYKNGPGEINIPVCCGGVAVLPGDILVGDRDGIVVIRPEDASEVAGKAKEKYMNEQKKLEKYNSGTIDDDHVHRTSEVLEAKNVIYF
jgi:regulator of RNase E activity RraA